MGIEGLDPQKGFPHEARRVAVALTLALASCAAGEGSSRVATPEGDPLPSSISLAELRREAARALLARGNFGEVSQHLTNQDALPDRTFKGRRRLGIRSSHQRLEEAFGRRGFHVDQDPSDAPGAPARGALELCKKFSRESACAAPAAGCVTADYVRVCVHIAVEPSEYFYTYILNAARWQRAGGQEAPILADARRDALIGEVLAAVDEAAP